MKVFEEMTFHEFEYALSLNYMGPISVIKKLLPVMIENGKGHIVNISSYCSLAPTLKMSDMAASKAALTGFHNALRLEIKYLKLPILTTIVFPYLVNTSNMSSYQSPVLLPVLKKVTLGKEIYDAIISKRAEVFLPWYYK